MTPQLLDGTVAGRPRPEAIRKPRDVWPSNPVAMFWSTMVGNLKILSVLAESPIDSGRYCAPDVATP